MDWICTIFMVLVVYPVVILIGLLWSIVFIGSAVLVIETVVFYFRSRIDTKRHYRWRWLNLGGGDKQS